MFGSISQLGFLIWALVRSFFLNWADSLLVTFWTKIVYLPVGAFGFFFCPLWFCLFPPFSPTLPSAAIFCSAFLFLGAFCLSPLLLPAVAFFETWIQGPSPSSSLSTLSACDTSCPKILSSSASPVLPPFLVISMIVLFWGHLSSPWPMELHWWQNLGVSSYCMVCLNAPNHTASFLCFAKSSKI